MTEKQELFCIEYLIDLNAAKAARRAGYSEDSAKSIGYELLNNTEISDRVSELMAIRAEKCEITANDVLKEFASIGLSNIKDFIDGDFNIMDLSDISRDKAKAIKSIKKTVIDGEFGTKTQIEFVLHDKVAGLTNIGRHIGFYREDNSQQTKVIQLLNNDPLGD